RDREDDSRQAAHPSHPGARVVPTPEWWQRSRSRLQTRHTFITVARVLLPPRRPGHVIDAPGVRWITTDHRPREVIVEPCVRRTGEVPRMGAVFHIDRSEIVAIGG